MFDGPGMGADEERRGAAHRACHAVRGPSGSVPGLFLRPFLRPCPPRDGYSRATPSCRACRATAAITAGATRVSNGEGMT